MAKLARARTDSRSDTQQQVESVVRDRLAKELELPLAPKRLDLGDGTHVALDGYWEANGKATAVEITAQVGKPRGAQPLHAAPPERGSGSGRWWRLDGRSRSACGLPVYVFGL